MWQARHGRLNAGMVVLETVGTLLGQGLYGRLSISRSNHILVGSWLFFGVVVGTAYRGSLIASLTLPRKPPRPETVEKLVLAVERVTFDSYGDFFKDFFSKSGSAIFQALGGLMHSGISIMDGLNTALVKRRAHLDQRQYLQLLIAKHFTNIDGSTSIYIGRERIYPSTAAWLLPHDAPYKTIIDHKIMAVTEAGLYKQWRKEILDHIARTSRQEEIRKQQQQEHSADDSKSLTIRHVQGPLILLLLGFFLGTMAFIMEKLLLDQPIERLR